MPYTLLVHLANEEAVMGDVDDLPGVSDQWVKVMNPRRKDNKDLTSLASQVTTVLYPMWRINYIEVMPGEDEEEITTFVRESPNYNS